MQPQSYESTPWWLSLMYSTGYLLLFCGLPGVPVLAWLLTTGQYGLSAMQALWLGLYLAAGEAIIAGILLFVAGLISKHRSS